MIRADVHMPYFRKFLWLAGACVAGIAWCAFDAWVTYPAKLEISEAYESFPNTDEGRDQWTEHAQARGWSDAVPQKSSVEYRGLIHTQYGLMVAGFLVGGFMFLKWFRARGSWIEGDETQLSNSRGKQVPLNALVSIDKTNWEEKGIAVLRFKSGWKSQKFVLDDFKYDREATGKLLVIAEEALTNQRSDNEVFDSQQDLAAQ